MPRPNDTVHSLERKVEQIKAKAYGAVDDEDRKTMDEVFDKFALLTIYKFMTDGLIDTIDYPISTGKEANVFRVTSPEGKPLVLKIYRTSNLTFKRIARYIENDPRFRGIKGSRRKVIFAWAIKEFRNLQRMKDAKVSVPEPIKFSQNMLLMEYLGTDEQPAPMIRNVTLEDPEKVYKTILKFMKLMYKKAELVHGDLSEYNILWHDGGPVIIDVGQAMTLEHPNASEFLRRDIHNINHYFRSLDVKIKTEQEAFDLITGVKKK
jgi:RIO kinase 1